MRNKNTPDIRFPGFNGEWEQRAFSDLVTRVSKSSDEDVLPRVEYEDIISGQGELNKDIFAKESDKKGIEFEAGDTLFGKLRPYLQNWLLADFKGIAVGDWWVLRPNEMDSKFIYSLVQSNKYQIVANLSTGTKMPRSDWKVVSETEFAVPTDKYEQGKIGGVFEHLDNLITLHQQELTTLKQTKQGFLQKMFPKEGESVPEVRFSGFTGDWEQRRLDSMVDRLKSYPLSRDVETSDYTGYKYIHYGDIHTKVADKIDKSSNLPNIKVGNYELLEKGDLVLADASEDYKGIATPAVITIDTPYKLVSGLHTIALRPKQVDSLFLYYLINSPIFRKYGYRMGTGMKVFGISVTNLLKFESIFPSFEEQTKIGNFFEQLDNTIALHQRELDALKETKKAFLQKMFA
ncbi:restriction endonuclease subunit S [Bacillus cereus]|nr:restriction endonuclease subunit S [Bacillus cereus]